MKVSDTAYIWYTWNGPPKNLEKKARGNGNHKVDGDYSECNIVNIGKNTHKSFGHQKRFAVTQTLE